MKKIKKSSEKFFIAVIFSVLMLAGGFAYNLVLHSIEKNKESIGENAVRLLYDFGTPEQLDYQMSGLKKITTEEVFAQLTIDNEERTLNTYLKFNNKSVSVTIIKSTSDYVLYTLDTKSLSHGRLFVFFYHVNGEGLIDEVREVEAVDFIKVID